MWRLAGLAGTLMFIWAAPASAATYCVAPATGCGGGDVSTLAAALTAASANAGADDVRLGAQTYTDGPWSYVDFSGTNPVTIRGTGQLDSRLLSAGGGPTLRLSNGNADNVLVYGPAAGVGVEITLGTLSNSQVLVTAGGRGVDASAATVDRSTIAPAGGSATGNLAILASNSTISNTAMSTTNGVDVLNQPVAVRRSTIVTQGYGLQSIWGGVAISDSLIVLNDSTAVGVQGICDLAIGTITIEATNLSVTGGGNGTAFRSLGGQLCGGHVAVSSTLVSGVGTTAECVPGGSGSGTASVAVSYSDADLSPAEVTGTCTGTVDVVGNFLADPLLASAGTLIPIPRFDSPLIDAGDPAAPGAGQPSDIAGLPRAVNGRRDIGAFEYGRRPPSLNVTATPATVATSAPSTFVATATDPDLGDQVSFSWSFDDGTSDTGAQVAHAFASPGTHTAIATATDSAGVTTTREVSVQVTAPGGGDSAAPETTITKRPKRKSRKRKATFAFTSSETGSSFECKLDKAAFEPCSSPFVMRVRAAKKAHAFSVVAIDGAGNRDSTPATFGWKVKKKR